MWSKLKCVMTDLTEKESTGLEEVFAVKWHIGDKTGYMQTKNNLSALLHCIVSHSYKIQFI